MIELGHWYLADAYYWRAFNERALKRLDAAPDDIERAKGMVGCRVRERAERRPRARNRVR